MKTSLTPAQHAILAYAINNNDGRVEWFPPNIKGGAQGKVLKALQDRQLITFIDPVWYVDTSGYDALGLPRPGSKTVIKPVPELAETELDPVESEPQTDTVVATAEATVEIHPTPRIRGHSKQATVIQLLSRPEGATLAQITEATNWQSHTTRGFLAGAIKKRLGLHLTSEKPEGGVRIYRVTPNP